MGQQQLILLVLGVILAGIAVIVGLSLFRAYSVSVNRDSLLSDIDHLAFRAMEYYRKPVATGGGGNSFVGFQIPMVLQNNPNGTFTIATAGTATTIIFRASGTEIGNDGSSPVALEATVTSNNVNVVVLN